MKKFVIFVLTVISLFYIYYLLREHGANLATLI